MKVLILGFSRMVWLERLKLIYRVATGGSYTVEFSDTSTEPKKKVVARDVN